LEKQQEVQILGRVAGKLLRTNAGFIRGCAASRDGEVVRITCPHRRSNDKTIDSKLTDTTVFTINRNHDRIASFAKETDFVGVRRMSEPGEIKKIPVRSKNVADVKLSVDGQYLLIMYSDRKEDELV